jgi:hypothetical protein
LSLADPDPSSSACGTAAGPVGAVLDRLGDSDGLPPPNGSHGRGDAELGQLAPGVSHHCEARPLRGRAGELVSGSQLQTQLRVSIHGPDRTVGLIHY